MLRGWPVLPLCLHAFALVISCIKGSFSVECNSRLTEIVTSGAVTFRRQWGVSHRSHADRNSSAAHVQTQTPMEPAQLSSDSLVWCSLDCGIAALFFFLIHALMTPWRPRGNEITFSHKQGFDCLWIPCLWEPVSYGFSTGNCHSFALLMTLLTWTLRTLYFVSQRCKMHVS